MYIVSLSIVLCVGHMHKTGYKDQAKHQSNQQAQCNASQLKAPKATPISAAWLVESDMLRPKC